MKEEISPQTLHNSIFHDWHKSPVLFLLAALYNNTKKTLIVRGLLLPVCSSCTSGLASGSCSSFVVLSVLSKVCRPKKCIFIGFTRYLNLHSSICLDYKANFCIHCEHLDMACWTDRCEVQHQHQTCWKGC